MEHLLFRQVTCAAFLLLLGAARYYFVFVSAGTHPPDRSSPAVNWLRHIPAYFTSAMWIIYVAWLIFYAGKFVTSDSWPVSHSVSELLGWIAIPFLSAGLLLFWYSHYTIGHYWSIQVQFKREHRLVTDGPYCYVRHPLYTALFVGYVGTLLALQSWTLAAWFPVFVASYVLFAREEESVLERGFGAAYRTYRQQTGMFLPKWARMRAAAARLVLRLRVPASMCNPSVAMNDETLLRGRHSTNKVAESRE